MEEVTDKASFLSFLENLQTDLQDNPAEWPNRSLEAYLGALARWVEDMDGYYQNARQPLPPEANWRAFASLLLAAKLYE